MPRHSEEEARWLMRILRARAELIADAANLPVSHVLKSAACTRAIVDDDEALRLRSWSQGAPRPHSGQGARRCARPPSDWLSSGLALQHHDGARRRRFVG